MPGKPPRPLRQNGCIDLSSPPMSKTRSLRISSQPAAADRPALTPEQKRFNKLLEQTEQARKTLAEWREQLPLLLQARQQVLVPLQAEVDAASKQLALALDRLLEQPHWAKRDRAALRELVCDVAAELLDAQDEPDPELKAVYDRHAEVDFDTELQQTRQAMKSLTEAMTGVDLGDDSFESDEDLMRRLHQKMSEQQAAAEAAAAARPQRRPTAAQKRRDAEAQQASQSLREVFRKLASALHPDRETDEQERGAKTALMQKVNQAYAAGDLLTLLELQLQIEQVDVHHTANLPAQRLKQYNRLLAEQLDELRSEITRTEMGLRADFGLDPFGRLQPSRLGLLIEQNARDLRRELAALHSDLRTLADKVAAKRWLARQRQRMREEALFDDGLPF
jgi:hypothetical protein